MSSLRGSTVYKSNVGDRPLSINDSTTFPRRSSCSYQWLPLAHFVVLLRASPQVTSNRYPLMPSFRFPVLAKHIARTGRLDIVQRDRKRLRSLVKGKRSSDENPDLPLTSAGAVLTARWRWFTCNGIKGMD
jgi:hypothetical protein